MTPAPESPSSVVFRVDASIDMGTGHVMRCLRLATLLKEKNVSVGFISRELPGNLCEYVEGSGFPVTRLKGNRCPGSGLDAREVIAILEAWGKLAVLVVDHYGLDRKWEAMVRPYTNIVMVIDDLGDRPHDCDILLDSGLSDNMETRYDALVPPHTRKFLGPRYALLRREFIEERKRIRSRDGSVRSILVFFGGTDSTNETEKAIEAIRRLMLEDVKVHVVVGASNPHKARVLELCRSLPGGNFHMQVEDMAHLMNQADLAVGGGGVACWERCYLGLPAITVILAPNQEDAVRILGRLGALRNLGDRSRITVEILEGALRGAIADPDGLMKMSRMALKIMGDDLLRGQSQLVEAILGDRIHPAVMEPEG